MKKTFQEVLNGRKSIRTYKEKKIPLKDLKKIVKDATKAPSNYNSQPWYFYIIKKPKQLKYIKKTIREEKKIKEHSHFYYQLGNAQAIIFVTIDKIKFEDKKNIISYLLSVGAAIENLLLSAENLGLKCCWVGGFENYRIKLNNKINFKKKHMILAGITIGYSNEKDTKKIERKPFEEIFEIL